MKQIYALIVMLMMASVAFTGCVSDDGDDTDDTVDDTVDPVGEESTSTLDDIIAAGSMKCGVKTSQFGMGYLAADGTRSGLDIEYCRALAAAIGLNPDTGIEYVLATGSNR
ncbi:MAG: hypothetical protein NZ842_02135, partial [Dehalococcoidia bacterium]|nr:hypothetical protein [Dehalococcoidia bacterium]